MKYVYLAGLALSLLAGVYLGHRLSPGQPVREVAGPTVEKEIIRTVTRTAPGEVKVVTEVKERVVTSPGPRPSALSQRTEYRIGFSLRPTQAELSEARVSAGRRLVGDLWLEAAYDLKRKDVTLGVSYEF